MGYDNNDDTQSCDLNKLISNFSTLVDTRLYLLENSGGYLRMITGHVKIHI